MAIISTKSAYLSQLSLCKTVSPCPAVRSDAAFICQPWTCEVAQKIITALSSLAWLWKRGAAPHPYARPSCRATLVVHRRTGSPIPGSTSDHRIRICHRVVQERPSHATVSQTGGKHPYDKVEWNPIFPFLFVPADS